jgi:hypothetical protein
VPRGTVKAGAREAPRWLRRHARRSFRNRRYIAVMDEQVIMNAELEIGTAVHPSNAAGSQ